MAGVKQIARSLKLGTSTVAYALSGTGEVSARTRQRVLEYAEQIGYIPNRNARRIRAKRTGVIGVVVPDLVLVYNETIQQLFRATIEQRLELQVGISEFNEELEDRAIQTLIESRVDGVLIRSRWPKWDAVPESSWLRRAMERAFPVVSMGAPISGSTIPAIVLPVRAQARLLTEHLLSLGHHNIAWLFNMPLPLYGLHGLKVEETRACLEEAGTDPASLSVICREDPHIGTPVFAPGDRYTNYIAENVPEVAIESARQLMRRALAARPRPTGIIAHNEVTAIGAIAEAQSQGLRVPEDIAVCAGNRTLLAGMSQVPLTWCDVSRVELARKALQLLLDRIEGRCADGEERSCEPTLHVAHSTSPSAAAAQSSMS
jgi:LacI family transcriptional regulator